VNPPSSPGKSKITIAVGRQSELAAHLVGSRKTAASLSLLAGHDHEYQAHPKKGATGPVSSTGVAEIVVGTGGRSVNPKTWPNDNPPLAFGSDTFGWLRITLHSTSADLRFVPVVGSFTDSRTITCKP
jgi:hypothetical protein